MPLVSMSSRPTGTTLALVTDEVDDRRSPFRIGRRRDDPEWLVEHHVGQLLLADQLPVDLDDVPGADERVQLATFAVDRNAAGLDQLIGGSPGRNAAAREEAVEAHALIVATVSRCARLHGLDEETRRPDRRLRRNVQPGQLVGVTSYLGKEELTREIARAAYERGARYVDVLYWDQWVKRQRLLHGDPATFDYIPPWMSDRLLNFAAEHAAGSR